MSEKNDNFQDLKRLLKLKRHEIPPPGFYNHFSDDIMARIRGGESGGGHILERISSESTFLGAWLRFFEARPGIIGAAATGLCMLLLVAVILVDHSESGGAAGGMLISQAMPAATDASASPTVASAVTLAPAADNSGITVSTNPVSSLQPVASLFGSQPNPLFQPVGFTQGAR
jgi:hypothetical protein